MAELVTTDQPANFDPQADQSAQNPVETPSEVSPAPQQDYAAEIAALRSQFDREKERNDNLERSLQIQERYLQSQAQPQQQQPQPVADDQKWTDELAILEKALSPILQKERKNYEPIAQGYGQALDEIDSMKFEGFLQRNNPDVLDNEDLYSRTMQQVEAVRQTARQRGMNISRVDAYVFNEGLQGTKQKITQHKQRKTQAATSESRRQAEVQVASSLNNDGVPRVQASAGIQAIRAKANRGDRLSQEERSKLRDFVSNVEL